MFLALPDLQFASSKFYMVIFDEFSKTIWENINEEDARTPFLALYLILLHKRSYF